MSYVPGNMLVPITMIGWIPIVGLFFKYFKANQAASLSFVLGWMFLPVATIPMKGLPDITKVTLSCVAILIGAWIFDRSRLLSFKPHPVDIPMTLWCTSPLLSSLANGLGLYDGLSESMYQIFTWGLPYIVARIYFNDLDGLNTLALSVFIGGLIYIPFCIEEILMSPQLHRLTYGYHQHSFLQTMRGGGFRPMVFMEHGLMVAMWMISAGTIGLWLTYSGLIPSRFHLLPLGKMILWIPAWLLLLPLIITIALMKSAGAFFLFILGIGTLFLSSKWKTTLLVWVLITLPPAYMITRTTNFWTGENLSTLVAEKLSPRAGQSLQFRFDNEKILVEKALDGTFFGWGGWNRSRIFNDYGKDISITDGLWIITLGTRGTYGLFLLTTVLLLPSLLLVMRVKPEHWSTKKWASVSAMTVLLLLYSIDCLPNGMVNPVFMLFNGGICGLLASRELSQEASQEKSDHSTPNPKTRFLSCASINGSTRFLTNPTTKVHNYENL